MLLAVDVHYDATGARTACVGFPTWESPVPTLEAAWSTTEPPAPYEPGAFYRRELPHVVDAVRRVLADHPVATLIVDGHAWLAEGRPGLGAHVHAALGGVIPVVGVAKSAFHEGVALPVRRGDSQRPLYVSAVGTDPAEAAAHVAGMHGSHRLPTLLKRADSLARGNVLPVLSSPGC